MLSLLTLIEARDPGLDVNDKTWESYDLVSNKSLLNWKGCQKRCLLSAPPIFFSTQNQRATRPSFAIISSFMSGSVCLFLFGTVRERKVPVDRNNLCSDFFPIVLDCNALIASFLSPLHNPSSSVATSSCLFLLRCFQDYFWSNSSCLFLLHLFQVYFWSNSSCLFL